MNAIDLIKAKGLPYVREIIKSAPANALQWNEGYEFKCGQNAATISSEDREKYFVDLSDINRLVESVDFINSLGGYALVKRNLKFSTMLNQFYTSESVVKKAIADYEAIYHD